MSFCAESCMNVTKQMIFRLDYLYGLQQIRTAIMMRSIKIKYTHRRLVRNQYVGVLGNDLNESFVIST